ncbi:hypothetical protein OJAV_G00164110 [Oryzias javanicus]|uniref:DEK-C domain-containing protein n=1 Tax=Oryzias javanicus TaxID=123683 RepID=A0A437CKG9_ORYJA|nr:hypothetical protein OJAV_G00164110 [Oryzias javanicus]
MQERPLVPDELDALTGSGRFCWRRTAPSGWKVLELLSCVLRRHRGGGEQTKLKPAGRDTTALDGPLSPRTGRGQQGSARHPEEEDCPISGAAAVAPPPRETAMVKSNGLSDSSTCGAMSSSAASEEDHEEAGPDRSGSSGGSGVLQGKRAKKTVERLDLQAPKQKEKLRIGDGAGDKLGDIPRTSYQISRMKAADLKPLHSILYDRPGKVSTMKRNLRLFNGFPFQEDSEQFHRKRDKLLKSSALSNSKLRLLCTVLDLEKKGTHSDLIHRILGFLLSPKNSGKRLPAKKRRRSKKKLSGEESRKKTRERSSCSPKKSRTGSKSSAIVMDSSSDEDEETAAAPSDEEEERRSESSEDEEQSSRSESDRAKKKTAPSQETPTKKRLKKRSWEELPPRKKKAAPLRPAAKVKKADSSRASSTDSSDDDQPLIRMVKTSPSDEKLKETLQTLLRDADLEEMTMKKICQQVFDMFPEHDLSSRKDFIKQTVKEIIT